MFRLLKFGASLAKLRHCGTLLLKSERRSKICGDARCYMTKTSEMMESKLKAKDMVPEGFRIVYRGGMDAYIHLAHQSSAVLTVLGIGVVYRTFYVEDEPLQFPVKSALAPIGLQNYTQVFIMHAVFFLMMIGMRQISSKYVLRMYYNPETQTYRAIKVGFLPTATKSYDFPIGILERQTKKFMRPWKNAVYNANGTKIIFFGDGFRTNADYDRLFKD